MSRGRDCANENAVWLFTLNVKEVCGEDYGELREPLNEEERRRAENIVSADRRREYECSRGFARKKIAHILKNDPKALIFSTAERGKPELADGGLFFNQTHKNGHAALAVTKLGPVGIDLESPPPTLRGGMKIAERFFSETETRALRNLGEAEFGAAFASLWSLKEAFYKCEGTGIPGTMRHPSFSPSPKFKAEHLPRRGRFRFHLEIFRGMALSLCLNAKGTGAARLLRDFPSRRGAIHSDFEPG